MLDAFLTALEPPALVQEVRKRRRSSSEQSQRQQSQRRNTALFIGAIVFLTDADGTEYPCEVTHQTPDGQWWCNPVEDTQ